MSGLKEDLLEAARCCRCEHSVCSDYSPETSHSDTCWHCGHGSGCHDAGRQALIARLRLHASSVEEREARLAAAEALIRRRHGMECPTYDDAIGTCQGCEVSAFLADEKR